MPLVIFSRELRHEALLGVWRATEPTDVLKTLADLGPEDLVKLQSIRLEKRQREWLSSRILLKMMARGGEIAQMPNGKPVLNNSAHISISHSEEFASMVLANTSTGIDIQGEDPKLLRIERKFINSTEASYLPQGPSKLASLALIWSVKEAVFKCFGEQVDFAKDIHVRPFDPRDNTLIADYHGLYGRGVFELENHRLESVNIVTTTLPELIPDTL